MKQTASGNITDGVNRYYQVAIWILVALRLLVGLALVYGGGWFTPALVLADLLLLRRTLSRSELAGYLAAIAVTALDVLK